MSRMIYLAGPIRSVGLKTATGWREEVAAYLREHDVSSFDPALAFWRSEAVDRTTSAAIESVNRQAIRSSFAVVALLARESWNIGTIREVEYAVSNNKRCLVVCEEDLSGKISTHDVECYLGLGPALASLLGVAEADYSRWVHERAANSR